MWLLCCALAAAEPVIEYHYPELDGMVYVQTLVVNVRAGPSEDAELVTKIELGHPVVVRERGAEAQIARRKDHWYRVSVPRQGDISLMGYIFGANLTPHRLAVDLDRDGTTEEVFASFDKNGALVVRLRPAEGRYQVWRSQPCSQRSPSSCQARIQARPALVGGETHLEISIRAPDQAEPSRSWLRYDAATRSGLVLVSPVVDGGSVSP